MNLLLPNDAVEPVQIEIIRESGEESEAESSQSRSRRKKWRARMSWERKKGKLKYTKRQLGQLRLKALQTRVKVREMRNALRIGREDTTETDVRFMKALQIFVAQNQSTLPDPILQLFEECQKARDTFQPLENDYNAVEAQLDRQEYELAEVEKKFYGPQDPQARESYSEPEESIVFDDPDSPTESDLAANAFSEYPPLLFEYMSRTGDAEIVRERLEYLRGHRAALVEEQSSREAVGLSLDAESRAFLENFDNSHKQLLKKLAVIESDVNRLRRACEEEGLIRPDDEPVNTQDEDPKVDLGEDLKLEILQPLRDPLLSLDSDEDLRFSDVSLSSSGSKLSRSKFINRWLLGGLRGSFREIRRLKSMPELQGINVDPETLKTLVLDWWPKDGAASGASPLARTGAQTLSLVYESEGERGQALSLGEHQRHVSSSDILYAASF
jgi:hypothetical protein